MIIVDGEGVVLGRMASRIAQELLKGEKVVVINAEKIVVSGARDEIFKRYGKRRSMGDKYKGPFFPRMPDRLVRRTVRGMLPWKTARGRDAFKRLEVHAGRPASVKGDAVKYEECMKDRLRRQKYVEVAELSKWLGAKV